MTNASCILGPVIQHLVFPVIATTVGTIVGGFLTYKFGQLLAQRAEFRREADHFLDAILPAILELKQRHDVDTYEIINKYFPDHQKAVERFSLFLDEQRREAFQKDWRDYLCADGLKLSFLEKYADCGQVNKRSLNYSMAIARLEALIQYARHNK